ncbi:MAG: hypothetical protein EON93_13955 [Burkholderiales bacterium]|nr:MAG: hypothetical protein EON93_13955 [Burkholderiales bacterium]
MLVSYFALGAAILLGVAGQLVLKSGAHGATSIEHQLMNPLTIGGFGIYVVSGLLYVISLKNIPVSLAYPSVAAGYGLVAIAAHYLWKEPLGLQQVGGIALICAGLMVLHTKLS